MKVDVYYETSWTDTLDLELKGIAVGEIYANFLYQIDPDLQLPGTSDAKSAVEHNKKKQKALKQIDSISRKIRNEPSIAKRQALARQRHELEMEINSDK